MASETITIQAKQVTVFFAVVVVLLVFAHVFSYGVCLYFGRLCHVFHFDIEHNLPSLFSSLILLFSSVLLFIIFYIKKRNKLSYSFWLVMGIIFLFLSVDEALSIHEKLIVPTRTALNTSGVFYFAWIIPYGIALAVFLILTAKSILSLPKKVRFLFIAAGITYISGAIGMELIGGWQYELYGPDNLLYFVITTIEEVLEMTGIVIFIHGLLAYIATELNSPSFKIVQ